MQCYSDLIEKIYLLTPKLKMNLIKDIYSSLNMDIFSSYKRPLKCPYCGNTHIVKNGKNKNKQRYLCKKCRKSFISIINTPVYYSKKNNCTWNKFLECLFNRYSVRKTAKLLKISPSTAFYWRHKVLDALRENQRKNKKTLMGEIECCELKFKESFKGNHSKSLFVMPREACYFTSSDIRYHMRRNVYVVAAIDNQKNNFIAPVGVGRIKKEVFSRVLTDNSDCKSIFISDYFPDLDPLKNRRDKTSKITVEFKNGLKAKLSCMKKISDIRRQISIFFKPFNGVATKYLYNYISLYRYIVASYGEITDSFFNKIFLENYKSIHLDYPIFIKGRKPFYIKNFKGRKAVFYQR